MQGPPKVLFALILAAAAAAQQEQIPTFGAFLAQPMAAVEEEAPVKSLCANYTKLYLQELRKFTLWAVQSKSSSSFTFLLSLQFLKEIISWGQGTLFNTCVYDFFTFSQSGSIHNF